MGDKSPAGKKTARFKWTLRIAVAFVVYSVVGFFIVPAIVKSQMLKRLPALTKREPSVAQVKCNPYTLSLTIRGFALKETDGEVFSSFDEFYANFQLWASLFKQSWVFDQISLTKPFAQIIYETNGTFNFANLLPSTLPAKTNVGSQALPSIIIGQLDITNGSLAFADLKRVTPFRTEYVPIDVTLTGLTTIRDKTSPYSILAKAASGESFAWKGSVTINPLRSDGVFRLGGFPLAKYSTYSHDYAKFEIVNGVVDVAADYRYDSVTNALDLAVSNAAVYLSHLELKAPETGEMVVSIPALAITNAEANIVNRTARIGLITSSDGSLLVRRNQDDTLNLLALLDLPKSSPTDDHKTSAPMPAFNARIDEIAFTNYTIKAEDKKPEKPASLTLDQLRFDVKNISNASKAPVKLSVAMRFQETGSIAVDGAATLLPLSGDVQLAITNLDLRSIQPYVEQQIKLAIASGALTLNGHARYAPPEPGAPLIHFTGDLSVTNFASVDDVLFKDFAKFDLLNVDGIVVDLQPDKLHVDQVKFTGLDTSVILGPDHRANVQTILRNQLGVPTTNAIVAGTPASLTPRKIPEITVGTLAFENASLHAADQSIEPHFGFDVQEFSGTVQGLSSQLHTTAVVDVKGKVDSHSPFGVSGKVNPLSGDLFADITVMFTNTDLTSFTPYTEKFAGRPLQKGKLSFGVHYLIQTNLLKAENAFYVDQLTLGSKNGNTNATTLPVKLAVALLKDRHGRIQLDVPVTGRLDDPKFRLGPIIWQVVGNIIVKAATSPFSLLGSMFGSGEELSFVNFPPGQAIIPDAETNKLEVLSKALYERPEVSLEINGSADPDQDRLPLAQMKLDQQIKSLWVKELTDSGKPAVAIDEVVLEPREYERLLRRDYKKTIGSYKATEAATNQGSPLLTNQPGGAQMVYLTLPKEEAERGAQKLFRGIETDGTLMSVTKKPSPASKANGTSSSTAAATAPPALAEPELADMQTQLLQKIVVTDDDLRDLMKQRAASVQTYLLKTGKVTGDRVFITAPKPITPSLKGEDRVNLTLD